jgi:hypothetical protein
MILIIAIQDRVFALRRTRVVNGVHDFSRLYKAKKLYIAGIICQYSWSWSAVTFHSGESDEDLQTPPAQDAVAY